MADTQITFQTIMEWDEEQCRKYLAAIVGPTEYAIP